MRTDGYHAPTRRGLGIQLIEFVFQFASELKYEFDQLYAEAATRRRMMSVSAHDRITGRPARTKVLEDFILYAQRQPGVVFLRKDQIARIALESSATPRE